MNDTVFHGSTHEGVPPPIILNGVDAQAQGPSGANNGDGGTRMYKTNTLEKTFHTPKTLFGFVELRDDSVSGERVENGPLNSEKRGRSQLYIGFI